MSDLLVFPAGFALFDGKRLPCAIGRNGMTWTKREGDLCTPRGVYGIEFGFYRADRMARPMSSIPFYAAGPSDRWSDDPEDPCYNDFCRAPHDFGTERLFRADPLYDLVLVLDQNRHPARPGAGSAIFIHQWRSPRHPTEGCIAFAPEILGLIVARWTPHGRVRIM